MPGRRDEAGPIACPVSDPEPKSAGRGYLRGLGGRPQNWPLGTRIAARVSMAYSSFIAEIRSCNSTNYRIMRALAGIDNKRNPCILRECLQPESRPNGQRRTGGPPL